MYVPNKRAPKIMTQALQTYNIYDQRHRYPQQTISKQNPEICGNDYILFKALHRNVHQLLIVRHSC